MHHVIPKTMSGSDVLIDAIDPDRNVAVTFYVVYMSAHSGWVSAIESATDARLNPIKSTHLTRLMIGGTPTGTVDDDVTVTGGRRVRCDIRGDIQFNLDMRAVVESCPDGVNDEAGNIISVDGPIATLAWGEKIYDLFMQYLALNPKSDLAQLPLYACYETPSDDGYITKTELIIPAMKLLGVNPSDMGGRLGMTYQPVILDVYDDFSPWVIRFSREYVEDVE